MINEGRNETRLRRVGSYSLEISHATFLGAGCSAEKISSCNNKLSTNCQLISQNPSQKRGMDSHTGPQNSHHFNIRSHYQDYGCCLTGNWRRKTQISESRHGFSSVFIFSLTPDILLEDCVRFTTIGLMTKTLSRTGETDGTWPRRKLAVNFDHQCTGQIIFRETEVNLPEWKCSLVQRDSVCVAGPRISYSREIGTWSFSCTGASWPLARNQPPDR